MLPQSDVTHCEVPGENSVNTKVEQPDTKQKSIENGHKKKKKPRIVIALMIIFIIVGSLYVLPLIIGFILLRSLLFVPNFLWAASALHLTVGIYYIIIGIYLRNPVQIVRKIGIGVCVGGILSLGAIISSFYISGKEVSGMYGGPVLYMGSICGSIPVLINIVMIILLFISKKKIDMYNNGRTD